MNDRVAQTIASLEQFMAPLDDALAIPRESGEFVHALILACGAKRGVEIGTSYGYSGLWIASALACNGGRLITIDRDSRKSDAARQNFSRAGLSEHVDVRTGTAADVLSSLDGPIDLLFSDADKENCITYVELMVEKLSDRAVVLTDNTSTHPDQLADFLTWMRNRNDFYTTTLPIGNGMELSIKHATV